MRSCQHKGGKRSRNQHSRKSIRRSSKRSSRRSSKKSSRRSSKRSSRRGTRRSTRKKRRNKRKMKWGGNGNNIWCAKRSGKGRHVWKREKSGWFSTKEICEYCSIQKVMPKKGAKTKLQITQIRDNDS